MCTAITAMNGVYQQCLSRCRHLASAEGLQASMHCNRMMPAISQSVADQLLYMSAIEMVLSIVLSPNFIHLVCCCDLCRKGHVFAWVRFVK